MHLFVAVLLIKIIEGFITKFLIILFIRTFMKTNIQFSLNRKVKSLSLAKQRTQKLAQKQNFIQKQPQNKNLYESYLRINGKQEFIKTNKRCNKAYTFHSPIKIHKFDIAKKNPLTRINHNAKNLKSSLLNVKRTQGLFIPLISFQTSYHSASSEKKLKNSLQTNMGKQSLFFPTFSPLKRQKNNFLSLDKKGPKINHIVEKQFQRAQSECIQRKTKENNYLKNNNPFNSVNLKKQYSMINDIKNFSIAKKQKLYLR